MERVMLAFWKKPKPKYQFFHAGYQARIVDGAGQEVKSSRLMPTRESADLCLAQWIVADASLLQHKREVRALTDVRKEV